MPHWIISIVCILLRKYANNGTYIYRLRNNIFIRTTRFDPEGLTSGAFNYISLVIEL
jgi:hypothetical protein